MSQMLHDLSPFIIKFGEDFGLRWYGFSYVLGFVFAYLIMSWLAHRQRAGLSAEQIGDLIVYLAFGTLIGGRLGYVFFYSPDLLWKFRAEFPFWGVLAVNEGGMSAHGGILGVIAASLLFAARSGVSILYLFDLCAVAGPLGIFFGRIANFINGELLGRPVSADFPLAVRFPQEIRAWPLRAPDHLPALGPAVEAAGAPGTSWTDLLGQDRADVAVSNQIDDLLNKVIAEVQNGNAAVKGALEPLLTPRHPVQLYAALGEGLLLFLILFFLWRSPRKPGFIGACFVVFYAVIRFGDEFFREPDAGIGYQMLDLTRGQWLSVAMGVAGLVLMFVWTRSASTTINGWGRMRSVRLGRRS